MARELAEAGHARYLGLIPPDVLDLVRLGSPGLEHRLHPLHGTDQVLRSSTDVLLLRAPYTRLAWALRDLEVRYLAVEVQGAASVGTRGAGLVGRLTGKARQVGRVTCGGADFDLIQLEHPAPPLTRRYLSEVMGVEGLVRRLDEVGARYAVLRWFESLPALAPGEDLDVLVADEHLATVGAVLAEEPGTIPVDLYSETGLEGSDYQGMAYYPPALAAGLLARAVRHASGCLVPAPADHLHSLAYHAVYHKGARSGLPSSVVATLPDPEHDYAAVLVSLARERGVALEVSLEGVDAYLAAAGWRPPPDTLRRMAETNEWIARRHCSVEPGPADLPEAVAFFVRERTLSVLNLDDVLDVLRALEFELVAVRELGSEARARCAADVRGGNWGRGPFRVSGGEPVVVVAALHYGRRPPDAEVLERYPRLTNSDVLLAKNEVRDLVRSRVGEARAFNPVHSSDDELEAWEYLRLALPDGVDELRQVAARRKDDFRTEAPVRAVLRSGRRAKVEVVDGPDGPVVRKTFGAHAARYLEREVRAIQDLAPHVAAVPSVTAVGQNWFALPYFRDVLRVPDRPDGSLVPLRLAREMTGVLREVHARGLDLVDAKPQNFMFDPRYGLKLVDLEFCHRYPGEVPDFREIYAFAGLPADFDGDRPYGKLGYDTLWRPFVGLSRDALLADPAWLQHAKRAAFRLRTGTTTRARAAARRGRDGGRRLRSRMATAYWDWARARALEPVVVTAPRLERPAMANR
ncbi:hypothetical protein GB883_06680 [Georgenia thermotolerans]|uniref:Phosphotransferase n=1 Tax=Georgenia thermotolerans TaxID=527326 RepID=A0A7J5URC9_9MICO|nr:hypothetical protein GB883_06680 [Georgenia thermotolerans]